MSSIYSTPSASYLVYWEQQTIWSFGHFGGARSKLLHPSVSTVVPWYGDYWKPHVCHQVAQSQPTSTAKTIPIKRNRTVASHIYCLEERPCQSLPQLGRLRYTCSPRV